MPETWIRILGWRDLQHYKDRSPPWIKLHRKQVLDDRRYRLLADASKAVLVDLWVLAAEHDGRVKYDLPDLEFRLHRPRDELVSAIQNLVDVGFVSCKDSGQIDLLADASAALDREEENRGETEKRRNGALPQLQEMRQDISRVLSGQDQPGPRLRSP